MVARLITQIILIYVLLNVAVYFLSDYSIFAPPEATYTQLQNEIKIQTANGNKITAIYLPNPKAKFTIIYSHGNAEDLGGVYPSLQTLYSWNFAVIGYDYEGYGTSDGKPNEHATYDDITAVYNYLVQQQKVDPQNIIVFGRSLGSGPTVHLATEKPVAGVILESAFISTYRVVTYYPIFFFDKYTNLTDINKIKAPILFIHGEQDTVIPFWHGQELYKDFHGVKENCWVPNLGHNDMGIDNPQIKAAILQFAQDLMQPSQSPS